MFGFKRTPPGQKWEGGYPFFFFERKTSIKKHEKRERPFSLDLFADGMLGPSRRCLPCPAPSQRCCRGSTAPWRGTTAWPTPCRPVPSMRRGGGGAVGAWGVVGGVVGGVGGGGGGPRFSAGGGGGEGAC